MYDFQRPLEYRYLNLDTRKFYPNNEELRNSVPKGFSMAIPNWAYYQCLIAASSKEFTREEAIQVCIELSFPS